MLGDAKCPGCVAGQTAGADKLDEIAEAVAAKLIPAGQMFTHSHPIFLAVREAMDEAVAEERKTLRETLEAILATLNACYDMRRVVINALAALAAREAK